MKAALLPSTTGRSSLSTGRCRSPSAGRRARQDRRRRRLRDRPPRHRRSDGARWRRAPARPRPRERGLGGGRRRRRLDGGAGDAVIVYPPYSCGLCVGVPRGRRHALRASRVHRALRRRWLCGVRPRRERSLVPLPPGVEPVDVAPHADAGLTAYHAVRRLAPLLLPGRPSRHRHRRRRAHRASARARARLERRAWRSTPTSAGVGWRAELGADEVLEGGRRRRGARGD